MFVGGHRSGHVFVQCPDWLHQKQGLGVGGVKFQSGMPWPRLILIVATKKAYLAFLSWSFSLSLFLSIIEYLEGYF